MAQTSVNLHKSIDSDWWIHFKKQLYKGKYIYIMMLPVIVYYILFNYAPMYGIIIAFKDFRPIKGILGSSWIGFSGVNIL